MPHTPQAGTETKESRRPLEYGILLILFFLVLAVFHPALQGSFLDMDDNVNISRNPHLTGLDGSFLRWALTDTSYMWRYQPLSWITWGSLKHFFGLQPFAFHLVVVLFHAANACLVFLLIQKLVRITTAGNDSTTANGTTLAAGLTAALWAVHPMRVETTAWAVELLFVQSLFFLLLSLNAYLDTHTGHPDQSTRPFPRMALIFFTLSLMTYPLALPLVAVIVVLDVCSLKRIPASPGEWFSKAARVVWIEKIPFIAVTLCFAAVNIFVRSENTGGWSAPLTLEQFGLTSRIMQAFYIWAYYVWKPMVPFDLSPVTTQLVRFDPTGLPFIASLTAVCGLTLVLLWQRKRWPVALALWLCYLALLVPVLGLTEHPHFPADRYSLVVGILLSIGLASWLVKRSTTESGYGLKPGPTLAVGIVIVLCAAASYRQTFVWRDNVSIFTHVLAKLAPDDPIRAKTHVRLGDSLRTSGDGSAAIKNYEQAASLAPDSSIPHGLIGDTLAETGDLKGAIAAYNRALQIEPASIVILNDLGVTYGKTGQLDLAVEQFEKILKLKPDHISAIRNLAFALKLQGKEKEAVGVEQRINKLMGKAGPSTH